MRSTAERGRERREESLGPMCGLEPRCCSRMKVSSVLSFTSTLEIGSSGHSLTTTMEPELLSELSCRDSISYARLCGRFHGVAFVPPLEAKRLHQPVLSLRPHPRHHHLPLGTPLLLVLHHSLWGAVAQVKKQGHAQVHCSRVPQWRDCLWVSCTVLEL